MDKQRKSSLTSFNFQLPDDTLNEEGVLSKLFDKVLSAVSGPNVCDTTRESSNLGQKERTSLSSIPSNADQQSQLPNSTSINSSLSKHLATTSSSSTTTSSTGHKESPLHNFPVAVHLDTNSAVVPRPSTSTTATNTTTVTVGNQKRSDEPKEKTTSHHATNTVQFAVPTTNNSNRKSQDLDALEYLLSSPINHRRSFDSDTQSIVTNFSISNSNSLSRILARLRGHKSDKEFWMPDEQCKECYKCRKPFTLLRRKHHCRTCGQIFCGRCASHVIPGKVFKQKGQVRVCNFCYAEQLQQYRLIKDTLSNAATYASSIKSANDYTSSTALSTSNIPAEQPPLLLDQADSSYSSPIIPSQKAPLAAPRMQIPTKALKQARSTYGNDDATTFALEIPIRSSDPYIAAAGSPQLPAFIERPHSSNAHHDSEANLDSPGNVIPTITTTGVSQPDPTASGGFKRLFDAGTSLLKSSAASRPRSNTSSSAPLEDTRYSQTPQQLLFSLDRGGGTVLAESELSPYPGTNPTGVELFQDQLHHHHHLPYLDRYQQQQGSTFTVPTTTTSSPPVTSSHVQPFSKGHHLLLRSEPNLQSPSHTLPNTMTGSDDESYDHTLRLKRTEELRGHNPPYSSSVSGRPSFNSTRRLSLTGSSSSGSGTLKTPNSARKKPLKNGKIHINTIGLPKTNYNDFNESWSPNPLASPFLMDDKPIDSLTMNRLRFPPRQRRPSSSITAPQTVELSLSARTHARKILRQLMQDMPPTNHSKEAWEDVILQLLLKMINYVQPDIRAGDDMDVRHYVKIKKIPGGVPSDSFYVKGVVCTKNVAHKRMVRTISHPRILILTFSLDYSRVEMENQLLSIAPVISQEREHIRKLVGRIVALKPSLLLVKSTVSRLALEFLLEANIPVVHNVKHSVIEAVARCTQASVVTSVDKLQHGLSFGRCGSFEIRTILHEWIPNRRKTFLVFDDCAPELGGTIVLRGEKMETLRTIKRLIDFMVFVVNNLKLETSLLLDSFAKSRGAAESDLDTLERNRSPLIHNTSLVNNKANKHCGESIVSTATSQPDEEDGQTVNSHYINELLSLYQNKILSVSQFVVFPPPYLLLVLKDTEDKLAFIHQQKRRKSVSGSSIKTNATTINAKETNMVPNSASPTRSTFEKQSLMDLEDNAILDAEYDLKAKNRQFSRAWEAFMGEDPETISPYYHQNIVVLYSSVCTVTTFPCQGPEIRMFGFYRLPSDKTLGQYVMDFCNDARQACSSSMCDHPMLQHYRSYAHGNARVNVMIEPFPCPLSGMSNKLLMWSYCKLCDKPTPVLPMSENTWNYSFGKFLETFLYQKGVHCRADMCPHDMARNHVRYFGYMDMTVRFQYDTIELLEVAAPPMKLFIHSQLQMNLKEAELKLLRSKVNKFYQSIIERNKAFPFDLVDPRKLEACKAELQDMSLEAQGEKKDTLQKVQNVYAKTDPLDTLTIQVVRRYLFQVVAHWDAVYADFVQYYLQPERELRKITTNQLRKMFPADISDASIVYNMDNERTKRATEVTDLPLLGIGLDGEDDDALIGHIIKRKTAATKSDEMNAKAANHQMILPLLSTTPSANLPVLWSSDTEQELGVVEETPQSMDPDHHNSFLRPEIRRRLSLDLMHELDEKFKTEEQQRNIVELISLNRMTSNKLLRGKSPGALSATFTPSRIPILRQHQHQQRSNRSPIFFEPFQNDQRSSINAYVDSTLNSTHLDPTYLEHHRRSKGKHIEKGDTRISNNSSGSHKQMMRAISSSEESHPKHRIRPYRHHSISHDQHVQFHRFEIDESEDTEDIGSADFLKRKATSRSGNRRFRSRLPRKKTSIQVYTHANDLVTEDIDDEFAGGNVRKQLDAMRLHQNSKRSQHGSNYISEGRKRDTFTPASTKFYQDNGIDADNDDNDISDDSSDDSDKDNTGFDYFSSLAPYVHQVIHQDKDASKERRKSLVPSNPVSESALNAHPSTSQQYSFAKPYFPFSDGQMDMSSGLSGDDENECDLPLASDLLKIQQPSSSKDENMNLAHLPNLAPDIVIDGETDSTTSTALMVESSDDIRHTAEKISFMKTLTNFLTDSGVGNLLPLESPLQPTEYLFPDSYVVVREDEPSTIIAYALSNDDYIAKMHDIQGWSSDNTSLDGTIKAGDVSFMDSKAPSEVNTLDNLGNTNQFQQAADGIQETLLRESGTHMRYNFSTGSTKFFCKIFFSEQFDALRRNCGCDESYIMSLASCIKWDSSGGKSGSAFLKTKDDRLLMKQMSKYELDAFLGFAPAYFQYMSEAFFSELPTVLAKIFGFYSIGYKNPATGKSMRMDVLVMENLFYQRNVKKIFDLKGSMRNRHVQSTGKQDEVLLDENLVELIYQSPLFIRAHSKEILRNSLHNDTLFLSNRNVMDYSLLVGIDEERQELVVGIVDFIRTFTWDKKLESWVKESGILGGGGKGPTIVSPRQYRIRFREAMERYFLMVPDFWALTKQSRMSYSISHHHATMSDSDEEL